MAARVRSGGHDIPEATIRRRYVAGLRMFFETYQPLVDVWKLYDNSGRSGATLVAQGRIRQRETWMRIRGEVYNDRGTEAAG